MSAEQNIQIAKKGYADFGRGDIAAILDSLDENVVWVVPVVPNAPGVPSGKYEGKAGVAQFFQHVAETWDFTAFEPKEYIASGDQVAVTGSYRAVAKATGRRVDADWCMVWKIQGGKVLRFQEYPDSAALAAAVAPMAARA